MIDVKFEKFVHFENLFDLLGYLKDVDDRLVSYSTDSVNDNTFEFFEKTYVNNPILKNIIIKCFEVSNNNYAKFKDFANMVD